MFISADIEGVAGVVNAAQIFPEEIEWAYFRKLMTAEVNAAIEGALTAGATQITVADSHGNGLSILPDELHPSARLIRSWPRPLLMMEGIENGFDAALLIGYHASVGAPNAVRAHTLSSLRFYDVKLNGIHASEAMLSAALAGHFDVPVALISGDEQTIQEAQRTVDPTITGVAVKRSIGYHCADSVAPQVARQMIREATQVALNQRHSYRPFKLNAPVRVELSFKSQLNAEVFALLPQIERVDGATIAFTGQDLIAVTKFLSFVLHYDTT